MGVGAGILSAMFGVGGGLIIVPGLVALGLAMQSAVGTSLAIIIPTALSGVYTHYKYGNVDFRVMLVVALGAIIGAQIGAVIAERISADHLKKMFGVLIILVGLNMILGK
ncbi:MAG: sulfite exporter TauE/SafE family protein [Candidatus Altiarchaeota archaeon]|nr:sulfite exporter TauE/SafE family protein [Candidatus Altiarchaeota archaeon]